MLATRDELMATFSEGPIVPTDSVGPRGTSSLEDTNIREVGFNRRTNFFIGAIVLAFVAAAALIILGIVFGGKS